jgi:hypothetical protein
VENDRDLVADIAQGLNTAYPVKGTDIENLRQRYKDIQAVMEGHRGADIIAYHTGETDDEGRKKRLSIDKILQVIQLFNILRYPPTESSPEPRTPRQVYSGGKTRNADRFSEDISGEHRGFMLSLISQLPLLLELYDEVTLRISEMPYYKSLDCSKTKGRTPLYFHSKKEYTECSVPEAWRMVIFSGLRVLAGVRDGKFVWQPGIDPQVALSEVFHDLYQICKNKYQEDKKDPDKVGKSESAYTAVEVRSALWLLRNVREASLSEENSWREPYRRISNG